MENRSKSSTRIKLKTVSQWLLHENQLRERQKSDNYQGSAIVKTVPHHSKASYLYVKGLRFRRELKKVEMF